VRYESLLADLEELCGKLAIPFEPERLGRFKSGNRINPAPFSAYYDDETASRVAELCRFEIDSFGYELHGSGPGRGHAARLGEQLV